MTSAPEILRLPALVAALTAAATLLVSLALAEPARADDGSTTAVTTVAPPSEPAPDTGAAAPTPSAAEPEAGAASPAAAVTATSATEETAEPARGSSGPAFKTSPALDPAAATSPASPSDSGAPAPSAGEPQGVTTITIVVPPLPAAATPDSGKPLSPGPDNGRPVTRAGPPREVSRQKVPVATGVAVERPAAVQRGPDARADNAVARATAPPLTAADAVAALSADATTVVPSRQAAASAGAGSGPLPGQLPDRAPGEPGAPSGLAGGVSSGPTGFALSTVAALLALVLLFPPWLLLTLGVLPIVWRDQLFASVLPRPG